jgi:hypothetical protein
MCASSQCTAVGDTVTYGNATQFSPCGTTDTNFSADTALAQLIVIGNDMTLTGFGVFGNQPASGLTSLMALYTDVGGAPSALVNGAVATSADIVAGNNLLPVSPPAPVAAGTYWIVAEYNVIASLCTDTAIFNQIDYVTASYGALPNPFGTAKSFTSVDLPFYVVGTP